MKKIIIMMMMMFFALSLSLFSAERLKRGLKNLPNILILTTGGTIAGKGASETGSGYTAGQLSGDDLIAAVPELETIANIKVEEISNVPSQNMSIDIWLKLAKRINEALEEYDCDGIVITHGTDTMEETAYFLNLTVHSDKPVVLTGSMRPSTSISADGNLNLYNAVACAGYEDSYDRGVLVLLNDKIYTARNVTKTNTTNVETFRNLNGGPVGYVHFGEISYYYLTEKRHTVDSEFDTEALNELPRIEIIYGYADSGSLFVDAAIEAQVDGIIYASVGDGNAPSETLESLQEAAEKGIKIVVSSRTGSGIVCRDAEYDFEQYDFISADNLSPQQARILLMLALVKSDNISVIQEYFYTY